MTRIAAAHRLIFAAFLSCIFLVAIACHSYHIDTTIENRTGADIQLLEVDYPSASFGADRIASGAVYHYRFQVNGSGFRSPVPPSSSASRASLKSSFCPAAKPNSFPSSPRFPDLNPPDLNPPARSPQQPESRLNAKRRTPFPEAPPVQHLNVFRSLVLCL